MNCESHLLAEDERQRYNSRRHQITGMNPPCIAQTGRILSNATIAHGCKEISIEWDGTGPLPKPGQFLTILPRRYPLALLRRPFAYSSAEKSKIAFVYEIRGTATQDLASMNSGDEIDWMALWDQDFPCRIRMNSQYLLPAGLELGPFISWQLILFKTNVPPLLLLVFEVPAFFPP